MTVLLTRVKSCRWDAHPKTHPALCVLRWNQTSGLRRFTRARSASWMATNVATA